MKKFIFGFAALVLIGMVVVSLPKQENGDGKQKAVTVEDSVDDDNWFYIETLSNKDIYFKADTSLPDNRTAKDQCHQG